MIYFLKMLLFQAFFAAVYSAVLRDLTYFSINRVFILCALLLPLVLPFISLNYSVSNVPADVLTGMAEWQNNVVSYMVLPGNDVPAASLWQQVVIGIYALMTLFFFIRFLLNLYKTLHPVFASDRMIQEAGVRLFRIENAVPYSFFNRVYIPTQIWNSAHRDRVISHEKQHVKKKHSLDRLAMECILVILWFNPFIHFFRNWLIEVHEFEADAGTLTTESSTEEYQRSLLMHADFATHNALGSFFNFSILKRRIQMMNKSKSSKQSMLRYALFLPVLTVLFILVSFRPIVNAVAPVVDVPIFRNFPFELSSDSVHRPMIFPVQVEEGVPVRITSHYGQRRDPMRNIIRMHQGMDIAAPIGTPVMATADGVVTEMGSHPEGYGNFVVITHGEMYATKYAQLQWYDVSVGESVRRGEVIGTVGNTGRSTGPHLHYEVRKEGDHVDPRDYMDVTILP